MTLLKTEKSSERQKIEYITLLNVLSAIAVVCLHTNGCFWTFSREPYWFTANIIECVFYFAVPVFFMISGATLIDYKERYSTGQFMVRRIKKTVIPFVAWSLIGLLANLLMDNVRVSDLSVKYIVNGILGTSIIGIYWFFPALFCVYLCIPLFASVEERDKKKVFSYLTILCFAVNCFVPFINTVCHSKLEWPFSIGVGSGYLLYLLIGYLLNKYDLNTKERKLIYLCAVIGLLMHIVGTYRLSMESGVIIRTFKGYNNVPCILYSVGIWVFFKEHGSSIMRLPVVGGGYTPA